MRSNRVLHIAGTTAKVTTVPPPPWEKKREFAHLQKFKEFNLGEFPWVHSHFALHGRSGGWLWGDAKQMVADRKVINQQHKAVPTMKRYSVPSLPHEQQRMKVPQAAKAVLAAHLRGRSGGYGLGPEQVNIPLTVRHERPELDTAKKDEPRTARARWAQYRNIEVLAEIEQLGLSKHAQRRFQEAYGDYLFEGTVRIQCDDFEDFWDNYEKSATQLNRLIADSKKADIHTDYRPMEQFKLRESAIEHANNSVRDWYTLQSQSLALGEKYCNLKEGGAESVTGFNLYQTPAYMKYNAERAARKKLEVELLGVEEGYAVDKMSAAISMVRDQQLQEDEAPVDDDDIDTRIEDAKSVDFTDELEAAMQSESPTPSKPPSKPQPTVDDELNDLLSDFVDPTKE